MITRNQDGFTTAHYSDEEWCEIATFLPESAREHLEFFVHAHFNEMRWKTAGSQKDQLRYSQQLDEAITLVLGHLQVVLAANGDEKTRTAISELVELKQQQLEVRRFVAKTVPSDGREAPEVLRFIRGCLVVYGTFRKVDPEQLRVGAKEEPNELMRYLRAASRPVLGERHPESLWRLAKKGLPGIHVGHQMQAATK